MAFTALATGAPSANAAPAAPAPKASDDRAWTTTGDAEGFHIMVADAKDGYGWRTAASLSEPGFDTDMWIGNACVTGSGQRAVVVYAPRTFTNKPDLMARGGFTAVVDLATGTVTKLDLQASLSYYNPGCGVDETAVLTQSGGEDKAATRLIRIDAATGTVAAPVEAKGQVTSAVPVRDGSIVAADAGALVKVEANGTTTEVTKTSGVPFRITADKDGGVVYLDKEASAQAKPAAAPNGAAGTAPAPDTAKAKHVGADQIKKPDAKNSKPVEFASGPLTETGVSRDAAGTVYITGPVAKAGSKVPSSAKLLPSAPKEAKVSTKGESVVTHTQWADGKDSRINPDETKAPRPVTVALNRTDGGQIGAGVVDPAAKPSANSAQGSAPSPKLKAAPAPGQAPASAGAAQPSLMAADPTEIVDSERTCAVPRNDPRNQALQPKPRQVEWAVDQAIVGNLNAKTSRPANWRNLGMPAYQPQTLFPLVPLSGGNRVPAQILLGITAQESNMWQAARSAVPGVTGNPLIGNYYGINYYDGNSSNDWDVNWAKADCGYGVTQVTDGMRLAGKEKPGETALPYQTQRAVALDYATNIAAGLQILSKKWNQTRDAGMVINNGNPAKLENWFFALWAYNSGFYPNAGDYSPWGVGWANNPANPEWDAGRLPFLENQDGNDNYAAAAHPQDWPYQEKVIGWAGHPLEGLESPGKLVSGYRQGWWNGGDGSALQYGTAKMNRALAKPLESTFCTDQNTCSWAYIGDGASNDPGLGPCNRDDLKCWWNASVTWKNDCDYSCGNEFVRFNTTYAEEADGTAYPPVCGTVGLSDKVVVVDDQPDNVPSIRPNCGHSTWSSQGTFTMAFGNDPTAVTFPAKVDLHQLGAGLGGHFYFAHTRADDAKAQLLKVTGTWTADPAAWAAKRTPSGEAMVQVHLPDHGAQTKVTYQINTDGGPQYVTIDQQTAGTAGTNRWVTLGTYSFRNTVPQVQLTNIAPGGAGDRDVAYDGVAFIPGDFSKMPHITLPEADPTAPDRDAVEEPIPINGSGGLAAKAAQATQQPLGSQVRQDSTCADRDAKTRIKVCSKYTSTDALTQSAAPSASDSQQLPQPGAQAASGPSSTEFVPWCPSRLGDAMTRTAACIHGTLELIYFDEGDAQIGTATFMVEQQILLYINEIGFDQSMKLTPAGVSPNLEQVNLSITFLCDDVDKNCSTSNQGWTGSLTWFPFDNHTASAFVANKWTKTLSGPGMIDKLPLGWRAVATSPITAKPATSSWDKPQAAPRCDNWIPARRPGCVFPDYTPTYLVNTAQDPTAAAMYWIAQQKLPTHPGIRDYLGQAYPLHRVSDTQRNSNRKIMCELAVAAYTKHPLTPDATCDEYAFAVSKESGAMQPGVTSGGQCAQFYAEKLAVGWTLWYDNRVPIPTWQEKCARGSIPGAQNSGAADRIGLVFFANNRVMLDDAWYVSVPGFEGCDPIGECMVSTRP
ncbi:hypothetical protein [Kitasatospora sp. NPDC090091]|uniref:golvesin C-terminal-like domain-containing protein n=1 Tax=Kitasatospora sp. NPDC090091 TaxID=3364081 RepID=UPI0037FEB1C1